MSKIIPYLVMDRDFKVVQTFNDIDRLYPFLLEEGFFKNLFRCKKIQDFSSPFLCYTSEMSRINLKLLIAKEGDGYSCYITEDADRAAQHTAVINQMQEPVSGIFALLPIIVDSINHDHPDKAVATVEDVYVNSYSLIRNINNLSLFDRISCEDSFFRIAVNFSSFLESLVTSSKAIIYRCTINREIDDNVIIMGNRDLLLNGIMNLIANSLKFRTDRQPVINIKLKAGNKNAVFTYSDNSKGIKEQFQQDVFRPFFSRDPYADGGNSHDLGLGLYIAHFAFEQAGGNMLLTSEFGEGVKYTVSLPLAEDMDMVLESNVADFLSDKFSDIYVQLGSLCKLPPIK